MAIEQSWQGYSLLTLLLWPLSLLFRLVVALRRLLFRCGLFNSESMSVPVVVVGNITVGGSGKTPLVIELCRQLREQGYKPGVISRGYGGQAASWPQAVDENSSASLVGDEPLLIARRSSCPVVVGPDRIADARLLLERFDVDLILTDDGLQHYRLQRDIELNVVDARRRYGNGLMLPAGPLREPLARLEGVDFIICNGEPCPSGEWPMALHTGMVYNLADGRQQSLQDFAQQDKVHAVAGIGHPQRFFDTLEQAGLKLEKHVFADHHPYTGGELDFGDGQPVLMTEKDAVKYQAYADDRHWALSVQARLPEALITQLNQAIAGAKHG